MKSAHHLILHGLAIKKYAGAEDIAGITGADPAEVARYLAAQVENGRVVVNNDKYSMKPTTRVALSGDYSRHYWRLRQNTQFVRAYEDFEKINISLKQLITSWQIVEVQGSMLSNNHSDEAYDSKIIDHLGALHERADRILAALTSQLPRMQIYRDKLTKALEKAEDGAIEWVSDARTESYHTLWFELHEDLLCMMGWARDEKDDIQ